MSRLKSLILACRPLLKASKFYRVWGYQPKFLWSEPLPNLLLAFINAKRLFWEVSSSFAILEKFPLLRLKKAHPSQLSLRKLFLKSSVDQNQSNSLSLPYTETLVDSNNDLKQLRKGFASMSHWLIFLVFSFIWCLKNGNFNEFLHLLRYQLIISSGHYQA